MKYVILAILAILGIVVSSIAVDIEILNANAGYYLPRTDRNLDGSFADGKWRISAQHTARDQLRSAVESIGLIQYLLASILLGLSVLMIVKKSTHSVRIFGSALMAISTIALCLCVYRGYFTSLGW